MTEKDYDDPAVEEAWCSGQREQVVRYMESTGSKHGEIGDWPAWHLAPYVSIWAVESIKHPGSIGFWVISGDLPTDYISAAGITHPREAMMAFSKQWEEMTGYMERGESHPTIKIAGGTRNRELAPLLKVRAEILHDWVNDDSLWNPEYD